MGISGLTSYIAENSHLYLKPYELSNCQIVVDGNSTAFQLYKWMTKSNSAFGGDYDEYYSIVKQFFLMLKKCNVTPIVLLDGGYEKKKIRTILERASARLALLRRFSKGFSPAKFFPLFLKETFIDVMVDLKILIIETNLEADMEIAALARALNCPVLSYDSDFYVFDVLYISLASVHSEPIKSETTHEYFVKCLIYDVKNFVNKFSGLDKSLLPIAATLLGNDYVPSSMFDKFFGHVSIPKTRNKSYTQRKIHGLMHWLKKENVDSATNRILSHLETKNSQKVLNAIKTSLNDYNSSTVSESVFNELTAQLGELNLNKKPLDVRLPSEILQLMYQCRVSNVILSIINLRIYFTSIQIEDLRRTSSHLPSLKIIQNIDVLLHPFLENNSKPLKVYLINKNQYSPIKLDYDSSNFLNFVFLTDILKQPKEERLKWFCSIVGIEDDLLNIVTNDCWAVFLTAFIYWIRQLHEEISLAHVHALILMVIVLQVVQKSVGYYKKYTKFTQVKRDLCENDENITIKVTDKTDFKGILESITLQEKFEIQDAIFQQKKTFYKATGKSYSIETLHLYACFQSCLYHIMIVNSLLNYPLPRLKISEFYSGTLLFNFYLLIKSKPNVEQYGFHLFKDTPNISILYSYLSENLKKFARQTSPIIRRRKPKKKNKKINQKVKDLPKFTKYNSEDFEDGRDEEEGDYGDNECDDDDDDDDDDDGDSDYEDENNFYSVLKNVE